MNKNNKPLIGISCCNTQIGLHSAQFVVNKYVEAVIEGCHASVVLLPSYDEHIYGVLEHLDGLFLTGSYSNMEPHHYNEPDLAVEMIRDPARDKTNLNIIHKALAMSLPVLGICRGFQEMNVALGGSLHQQLFSLDTMLEHREPKDQPIEKQYALAHSVKLNPQGILAAAMNNDLNQQVNSLHGQGVNQLAESLQIEATAPDGLVEAFSLGKDKSFYLGVQWHPEWQISKHPFYQQVFSSFEQACLAYQQKKNQT